MTKSRSIAVPLVCGFALGLGACSGHGKYTTEHVNAAQERMTELKSATEWDLARSAYKAGELKKALKKVDQSLSLNPDVPKSHHLRGKILLEMDRLEEARVSFQRAAHLDPQEPEVHYYLGVIDERTMQRRDALQNYTRAAQLDPTDPQYAIAVADTYIELDRLDDAERFLSQRHESFKHTPALRQTLGNIAMIRGEHAEAVDYFSGAHLLAPNDQAILEDLIRAQMLTGDFGEAGYNIAQLLEETDNTNRRDLRQLYARCLMATNRLVEARTELLALTEGHAGAADIESWIQLGHVAYTLKDSNRLRQAATRVQALDGDRAEGYILSALHRRRGGNYEGAIEAARQAQLRNPTDASTLSLIALCQQDLGQYAAARQTVHQAMSYQPNDPSLARLLSSIDQSEAFAAVDSN